MMERWKENESVGETVRIYVFLLSFGWFMFGSITFDPVKHFLTLRPERVSHHSKQRQKFKETCPNTWLHIHITLWVNCKLKHVVLHPLKQWLGKKLKSGLLLFPFFFHKLLISTIPLQFSVLFFPFKYRQDDKSQLCTNVTNTQIIKQDDKSLLHISEGQKNPSRWCNTGNNMHYSVAYQITNWKFVFFNRTI